MTEPTEDQQPEGHGTGGPSRSGPQPDGQQLDTTRPDLWPVGQPPGGHPQPYQGSYPASPFDAQSDHGQQAGYWQHPGHEAPGAYGGPGEHGQAAGAVPPDGRRPGLLVGLVIAALVLVVGAVAGIGYVRGSDDRDATSDPGTAASASASSRPTSTPPSTSARSTSAPPTSASPAKPDPLVPGWQVAFSGKRKIAYDVPPDWKVLDDERIIGFSDPAGGPPIGMSGAAVHQDGYCAEADASWRAATGLSGYQDTDLALVATDAAGKWARYGYLGPNGEEPVIELSTATNMSLADDLAGSYVTAHVRVAAPDGCAPPSAVVHTVALAAAEGSYVFVLVSDQEVPEAVAKDTIDQIVGSLRATG